MSELKREIKAVTVGVLVGRVERRIGAVVFMGYNTLLKAVEAERRVRETDELAARLDELEERLARYKEERRGQQPGDWYHGA